MYLRALRTIFNLAIENELIDPSKYPFKKYTIPAPQKISRILKHILPLKRNMTII
jgi:hypothetical protein